MHRRSQDFLWGTLFLKNLTFFVLDVALNIHAKSAKLGLTNPTLQPAPPSKNFLKNDFFPRLEVYLQITPKFFSSAWGCSCMHCTPWQRLVCGWHPTGLVTHGPYLSARDKGLILMCPINSYVYFTLLYICHAFIDIVVTYNI